MATTLENPTSETIALLQELDLFSEAPAETLASLAEHSEMLDFSTNEWIFREHDEAHSVYFVVSGTVSLATCRPVVGCRRLTELGRGELLGWSSLAQRPRLSASAAATEPVKVIKIQADRFHEIKNQDPVFFCEFMQQVTRIVAQRLAATRIQMLDMCGVRLPEVQIETD